MDYPNHYLTHPAPWDTPEAVTGILYFDSDDECGGATRVVPREGDGDEAYSWPYTHMPGVGGRAWINDRAAAEKYFERVAPDEARFRKRLYEREVELSYRPGTLLLYRFDTWHRGTPLKQGAPNRRVLNFVYARDDITYITPWNCRLRLQGENEPDRLAIARAAEFGFARSMYFGAEDELNHASVARKSQLGVPPPGDLYWSHKMLQAILLRFPHGDWRAYATISETRRQEEVCSSECNSMDA